MDTSLLNTSLLNTSLRIAMVSSVLLFSTNVPAQQAENPPPKSGATGVAMKVEKSVKRGVKATGNALERAGNATGRGINKAAQKIGLPAQKNKTETPRTTPEPG